ncbi:Ubiquitin fusion degradation protein 4 [Elasticomyces elasticus]|nr:Ubiquitin fusion degradation protein 4 [Elasticomyces elasticus]KAK4976664.1 Ubiquitin fusion degradation protein 4 [Elasticomyces elasticus]
MKTRAATARLQQADPAQPPPPPPTGGAASPLTTSQPASRKRKAEPAPPASATTSSRKRSKANPAEAEVTQTQTPAPEKRRRSTRSTVAADMSETSPEQGPADTSKHRSSRKKPKDEAGASSSSRKTKKGAKKEQDVIMNDDDEKAEDAAGGAAGGATASELARREEELDEMMEQGSDPFGGYMGRFGGHAGLSSSLRALSGIMSGTNGRLRNDLEQLRMKEDPSVQLIALQDLSELLLVSNEDNLAGHFAPDQYVKELVALMQPNEFTGEENPEIMLLACRCIANMMEAMPASTASVVYGGAVPILCQKLLEIHFIDLAEQALSTLEKISVEFPSSIVREGGLTACLTYLDFFATSTQRTAVTTAANCCRNIPDDSFPTVRDVMPILLNTLSSSDQRVVEQASLCVSRIVDSFKYKEDKLEELISTDLLKAILRLLLPGSTNMIGPNIHTQFLRVLSITARASSRLSVELLKMNVVDTLYQILTGVSAPSATDNAASNIDKNIIMQAIIRTPREQIFETLNVICELLPTISRDNLTFLDDLVDAGNPMDRVSMSTSAQSTPNDKKLELLKDCPAEVKRFAVILFPTLMHAFTSTVNLGVRQKVLTAQLKMLSNFDTEILKEALLGVSYASHLASILTQQDNASLVTFALQAAELLLKRMEDIYRPQFYREGVMTEIAKLAERSMKSEVPVDGSAPLAELIERPPPQVEENEDDNSDQEDEEPVGIELDVQPVLEGENDDENDDEDNEDDDENENENETEARPTNGNGEGDEGGENDNESDDSEQPPPDQPRPVSDVQDIITVRAKRFMDAHGHEGTPEMRDKASRVMEDLRSLASDLKTCYSGIDSQGGTQLFQRLAKYFDGDALQSVTSYELMSSGIVDVLLALFSDPDEQAATEARSDFLEIFMSTGNIANAMTGTPGSPATPFGVFVTKLQDLLSRAEQFEVITVERNSWENGGRSAASMLAKQIRLKLVADDDSGIPRHFRNIMVSIHAIATFKALDDYLRPRISMAERPARSRRDGVTSAMAAYSAIMAGREARGGPPPALPTLGSSLPTRSSSKKTSRSKSTKSEPGAQTEGADAGEGTSRLRRSSRRHASQPTTAAAAETAPPPAEPAQTDPEDQSQATLDCPDEAHLEDEDDDDMEADLEALVDDLEEGGLDHEAPDPTAVNLEVANSGKVTARTEDGDRVGTPSQGAPTPTSRDRLSASSRLALAREMLSAPASSNRPMSFAQALQSVPQDWHLEFTINDQPITSETTIYRACHFNQTEGNEVSMRTIWSNTHTIKFKKVQGPPPTEASGTSPSSENPLLSSDSGLPPSLDKNPVTASILRLMSIMHDLNSNLDDVLAENKTAVQLHAEPLTQFVNTKLTAKLNRQLEEPLIVASLCLPTWSEDLARLYPFLFPFETRHLFLQSTSFGYARSMSRWQGAQETDSRHRHRDERPFLGRIQRQKVRISRSRILESAIKVMELYGGSQSQLEVEYFEEVGTGLGPTLEFYSTVSKEFSKQKTKLWRENESESGEFAFGKRGLFPAPMDENMAKNENGQRVLHLFKMLGKFVARSMMDSRIIDVSFNPAFFRIGEGGVSAIAPSLGTVAAVDQDLARSLKMLKKYVSAKQRIDDDDRLSDVQKQRKIAEIRINDALVDDLGLDFTLPGYPHIELIPRGSSTNVNIENVSQYIRKVVNYTLGTGVQRQIDAFRAGFSQVFPYSALKAFTPDELVMLFGRVDEDWSLETLMDSIKADHGYNLDSKSVRNLLQVMSELPPAARRDFLQFVTGSPKLPIGGFKSLTPMFTVVCKPSEPPLTSDDYLPSVMTCANYLKMPDYSSLNILKNKLGVAIKEGQGAFHLS